MRGMLVKDMRLMMRQKLFFVLLLFLAVMLSFSSDGMFVISYLTVISTFFVISTISYDEHANGFAFLMTLPVMRKTYVREKYIFGLLLGISGWGVGVLISLAYMILHGDTFFLYKFFPQAFILVPVDILISAIMIPFQFKFGVEKGRIAILIFLGIIFSIGFFLSGYFQGMAAGIMEHLNFVVTLNIGITLLLAFLVSIAVACISCVISCHIMCKKEF